MVIKKQVNSGFAPIIIVFITVGILVIGGGVYYWQGKKASQPVACTMEALICPDGSAVGRSGPNCEFSLCPGAKEVTTDDTGTTEKQLGFIKNIYEKDGKRYLDIDYVEWLTDEEAIKAMKEDGKCPADAYTDPSYCIPNGYYIRNRNPLLRTFEVSTFADISRLGIYDLEGLGSNEIVRVTFEDLKNLLMNNPRYSETFTSIIPFLITVKDGVIEKIEEQYIP